MKNGEDASTSKIDEEDLPPLQGVQDTKHKPWMPVRRRISLLKALGKTVGVEEALEVIGRKTPYQEQALAKNKQRAAEAKEIKEKQLRKKEEKLA